MERIVVLNSIPKAGSNLLLNIVRAIPAIPPDTGYIPTLHANVSPHTPETYLRFFEQAVATPQGIYTAHCPHSPAVERWLARRKARSVFLYRDPRDVVVSTVYYVEKNAGNQLCAPLAALPDHDARLMAAIEGLGEAPHVPVWNRYTFPSIGCMLRAFMPWYYVEGVLSVAYENLMDDSTRLATVRHIVSHLIGRDVFESELRGIWRVGSDPKASETFRRGGFDNWADEFSDAHYQRFWEVLREYGAEAAYEIASGGGAG